MNRLIDWIKSDKFKTKIMPDLQRVLAVIVFTIIYGIGVSWFLEASIVPLYTGGIPGVGQLVRDILVTIFNQEISEHFLGIFILIFNIPILVLGWFGVSHRFTIYSIISVVIQSFMLSWIPQVDMGLASTEHALAAAILGGLLIGIGAGGALKYGTSTGGLDIVAQYLAFKKGHSVGFFSMAMNVVIAILGGLIIGGQASPTGIAVSGGVIASYTIIRIIVSTVITDRMHTAYHYLSVNIITVEPKALVDEVLNKLYRGVTLLKVEGAYSHHEKTMVYIIISSYELHALRSLAKKMDPQSFVVTSPVKNVFGNFQRKTIA
ncbi:YitT family protein [Mycoplasmatota bacterium]|nr:YitT family protein [Mycoplasmatota bacterium]